MGLIPFIIMRRGGGGVLAWARSGTEPIVPSARVLAVAAMADAGKHVICVCASVGQAKGLVGGSEVACGVSWEGGAHSGD